MGITLIDNGVKVCYTGFCEWEKVMGLEVKGGWLDGSPIRQARKPYKCEYWRGKANGGRCNKLITVGSFYVEGEISDEGQTRNGAFLRDKYCPECAGAEAVASLPTRQAA